MIFIGSDAESSGNEHGLLDAASIRQNPSFDSPQSSIHHVLRYPSISSEK